MTHTRVHTPNREAYPPPIPPLLLSFLHLLFGMALIGLLSILLINACSTFIETC